ncbi:hypothetical protein NND09_05600 [Prevotella copri]|uniref:Uncharacterized protein n=1 Tax=Segatella copri TaxID=165179 RepID=A0AAW4YJN4_9BACT|nr:hypothetical protein [Segatella copri]MCE4121673.1 hypothetical protein [Segatella copri]MCP9498040.1 hypothetical protein [Segatella copri]MCP9512979.1 hypothetical protein [Segatella copri]MCP9521962.1 hypothetical protein [Segatella copri]
MEKLEYIPGDLVFHYIPKTTIKKYVKVYVCSTNNALSLEDMDGNLYDYIGVLYPIPLTPEILEKNGWKLSHGFYWSPNEEGAEVGLSSQTGYVWKAYIGRNPLRSNINNVSDLQHLLFGLGIKHEMEV